MLQGKKLLTSMLTLMFFMSSMMVYAVTLDPREDAAKKQVERLGLMEYQANNAYQKAYSAYKDVEYESYISKTYYGRDIQECLKETKKAADDAYNELIKVRNDLEAAEKNLVNVHMKILEEQYNATHPKPTPTPKSDSKPAPTPAAKAKTTTTYSVKNGKCNRCKNTRKCNSCKGKGYLLDNKVKKFCISCGSTGKCYTCANAKTKKVMVDLVMAYGKNGSGAPSSSSSSSSAGNSSSSGSKLQYCTVCHGTGQCQVCHGTGTYRNYGQSVSCEKYCSACKGTGKR